MKNVTTPNPRPKQPPKAKQATDKKAGKPAPGTWQCKVTTVGNSAGIVLTGPMLEKLGVKKGDKLHVMPTQDGLTITAYNTDFDEELRIMRDVMRRHRDVLRALSKR